MTLFLTRLRTFFALLIVAAILLPGLSQAQNAPYTLVVTNRFNYTIRVGEFVSVDFRDTLVNQATIAPNQTAYLGYWGLQSGFLALQDSRGNLAPYSSRLEFYADANGLSSNNVSHIVGRNASITLNDGNGRSKGDSLSIAGNAPGNIVVYDEYGRRGLLGYYDGATQARRDAANYMYRALPCGGSYIKPEDDRLPFECNPMTLAQNPSRTYYVTFGAP